MLSPNTHLHVQAGKKARYTLTSENKLATGCSQTLLPKQIYSPSLCSAPIKVLLDAPLQVRLRLVSRYTCHETGLEEMCTQKPIARNVSRTNYTQEQLSRNNQSQWKMYINSTVHNKNNTFVASRNSQRPKAYELPEPKEHEFPGSKAYEFPKPKVYEIPVQQLRIPMTAAKNQITPAKKTITAAKKNNYSS
jgi:hypothetical protein